MINNCYKNVTVNFCTEGIRRLCRDEVYVRSLQMHFVRKGAQWAHGKCEDSGEALHWRPLNMNHGKGHRLRYACLAPAIASAISTFKISSIPLGLLLTTCISIRVGQSHLLRRLTLRRSNDRRADWHRHAHDLFVFVMIQGDSSGYCICLDRHPCSSSRYRHKLWYNGRDETVSIRCLINTELIWTH